MPQPDRSPTLPPRRRFPPAIRRGVLLAGLAAWTAGCDAPAPATRGEATAPPSAASPVNPTTTAPPRPGSGAQRYEHQGVRVAFELLPAGDTPARPESRFREGDDVVFRFTIVDTSGGAAVPRAHPAAWAAPRTEGEGRGALDAAKTIARFIRGDRFSRPTLDLNVYYVLTLNDDATVTVVDPLFGLGNTRLLAMVPLKGNASDWALQDDQSRLYIATPSSDCVTVVDTASWSAIATVDSIKRPTRLALQPDGHYLWASHEGAPGPGVAVIATDGPRLVKLIATGLGPHDIAFDGDGRYAFVANRGSGTVTAVEVNSLTVAAQVRTGPAPVSVAYSMASRMLYVADGDDGSITVISPSTLARVGSARGEPGISQLRFAPGGRVGLAVNSIANAVHVLDAASGRVVQTVATEKHPDQVAFAGTLAYIRHMDSPNVRVLPLDGLGIEGRAIAAIDFPAGQSDPSRRKPEPSFASAIAPAPGDDAVLVGNPSDRTIYYYKQGMAAPLGSFSNYGRMPRAVLTVDRSLRERRPGIYETIVRLTTPGDYNLAFLLDSPRIAHYFDLKVEPDPDRARKSGVVASAVDPGDRSVPAGQPVSVRFRLTDTATGQGVAGLTDVTVLAFSPAGWQRRIRATPVDVQADNPPDGAGTYTIEWTPPSPGAYYLYASSPTAGVRLNRNWFHTLDVATTGPTKEAAR